MKIKYYTEDIPSEYCCFGWKDVKRNYTTLCLWKELKEKYNYDYDFNNREEVIWCKRGIRDYFKRESRKGICRVINGNADDCWESVIWLLELPKEIKTRSQAEDWFQYNERLNYIPSAYDCTGQQFTSWYKLFKRRGNWWCYHCVSIDI